jgi:peptidyl-prolyl cis-trans isomerase C
LLLVVLGAGLAIAFVPNRSVPAAATAATVPAAATTAQAGATNAAPAAASTAASADGLPTPSVPTALPLPQAIGDVSSTEAIAQVGDVTITRGEFVRAYQPGSPPTDILNQLIQVELVVQEAKAEGVTVDQKKVDDQISQIKQQNGAADDTAFLAFLKKNKIASLDELRGLLERDQVVEHMLLTHTTMEQIHARHILLAATADKVDARKAEAEDLLKQLQGGADFAQLATTKSEDPGSKDKGGDLGWAPRGLFVPEFDTAVFSMKKGELRLVKSQFGWHIIELLDLPVVRGLDSRDMLSTPPGQKAFTDTFLPWVAKLKSDAEAAKKIKVLVTDDQLVTKPGA